jgi:hypothetical protein
MPVQSARRTRVLRVAGLMLVVASCGSSAGDPLAAAHWTGTSSVPATGPPPPGTGPLPAPTMIAEEPERTVDTAVLVQDDAGSAYEATLGSDRLVVTGGRVDGNNTRIALWPAGQPDSVDQLACATWRSETDKVNQQGIALRIRREPDRVRAITVTKNVSYGIISAFNIHLWDSTAAQPFDGPRGNQFWLTGLQSMSLPWRMCARVTGMVVQFAVWSLTERFSLEPDWTDPARSASLTLGPEWSAWAGPGHAGWYAGHLYAGHEIVYDQLIAQPRPELGPPTP